MSITIPELSNGSYRVRLSHLGGGFSAWRDLALTRWTEDSVHDDQGFLLFVKDLDHGTWWRAGGGQDPRGQISSSLEVALASATDAELRRLTLVNRAETVCRLQITSYLEVALNHPAADTGHPAFSKLFLETEYSQPATLLACRRPRSPDEVRHWLGHSLRIEDGDQRPTFETDRLRFIGRGRSLASPASLDPGAELSGTVGKVLDPILSLRYDLALAPDEAVQLVAMVAVGESRQAVEDAISGGAGDATRQFSGSRTIVLPGVGLRPMESAGARFRPAHCLFPAADTSPEPMPDLGFFNGMGGFSSDGSEYVIPLRWEGGRLELPPLPWVNVVSNPTAGFIASERGAGYTWSLNSRENRLTPWSNDPVIDPHGEAIYLRDEDLGAYWCPQPGPVPGPAGYEVRHGMGYSAWRHRCLDLTTEVVCFVPREDPVKLTRITVQNRGSSRRRISLFSYAELVLGGLRAQTRESVVTSPVPGGVLAVNRARGEFAGRVTFSALVPPDGGSDVERTGDRRAFLGTDGSPERPRAVTGEASLDERTGPGLDPCAGLRTSFTLEPGGEAELVLLLGEGENESGARSLLERYARPGAAAGALEQVRRFWRDLVSRVEIATPVPAIDLMVNGWLTYQNLSCRIWGRSAFYQSGGAYGFRDQLQDAAAMIYAWPELTRSQILLHASHQFPEGDVLHWWHPPLSKGIRTRFADDLLWLPLVLCGYLRHTGDTGILEERTAFVTGRDLLPGEDEALLVPGTSHQTADLYVHCCRAIDRSLTTGAHGLPLMGTGDWNDGMNRVGREGRGESVWLGFFLHAILDEFIPLCVDRGDQDRVRRYQDYQTKLHRALNSEGWDGEWYRRAFYDDGAPIGSAASDECRIDAIAQAWAVISRVAPADRAAKALDAAERELVDESAGIIRLLTPPFDRTPHDPGYIKGYLPGVRENGGQYTHGALWLIRALAENGRTARAARLLEMLSPITRGATAEAVSIYKVEPYVVAADVYGVSPHLGRGGWTWYTGSAGWMFRVALESILGFSVEGGQEIVLRPRIPPEWPGYTIRYRAPGTETTFEIDVQQPKPLPVATSAVMETVKLAVRDGVVRIPLERDRGTHRVVVRLGSDLNA